MTFLINGVKLSRIKLYITLFVFCSYLSANAPSFESQEDPHFRIDIDYTKPSIKDRFQVSGSFDVHQLMKNHLLRFSEVEKGPVLTTMFDDPMITSYINNLEEFEKKASIKRLYIFSIAMEIIVDPTIDLENESIENYRLFLEKEYSLSLPKYSCLQLSNETRVSSACALCITNLATYPEELLFEMEQYSNHSKRMLLKARDLLAYYAMEEASTLFSEDKIKLNQIENISIDFFENKSTSQEFSDRMNALFN